MNKTAFMAGYVRQEKTAGVMQDAQNAWSRIKGQASSFGKGISNTWNTLRGRFPMNNMWGTIRQPSAFSGYFQPQNMSPSDVFKFRGRSPMNNMWETIRKPSAFSGHFQPQNMSPSDVFNMNNAYAKGGLPWKGDPSTYFGAYMRGRGVYVPNPHFASTLYNQDGSLNIPR